MHCNSSQFDYPNEIIKTIILATNLIPYPILVARKTRISPSLVSAVAVNGLHPVPHSVPPFPSEVADKPPFNSSLAHCAFTFGGLFPSTVTQHFTEGDPRDSFPFPS